MRRCGPVVELTDETMFSLADRAGAVYDWPMTSHAGTTASAGQQTVVSLRRSAREIGYLAAAGLLPGAGAKTI